MKQFKNKKTGCIETVTNKLVIEQYEKYTELYEEVKEKKASKPAKVDSPKAE